MLISSRRKGGGRSGTLRASDENVLETLFPQFSPENRFSRGFIKALRLRTASESHTKGTGERNHRLHFKKPSQTSRAMENPRKQTANAPNCPTPEFFPPLRTSWPSSSTTTTSPTYTPSAPRRPRNRSATSPSYSTAGLCVVVVV